MLCSTAADGKSAYRLPVLRAVTAFIVAVMVILASASEFAIEVTETRMFGHNKADSTRQLEHLRAAGCDVSLDHFGKDYSSITQIKELPCTAVKVDKSFVHDVESNEADQAIIEAPSRLGKTIGFKVVLKGVETAEQRDLLKSMGCRSAQGYHYSPPVAADDVPALIARLNGAPGDQVETIAAA